MSEPPEDCPGLGTENSGHAEPCEGCPNQANCQSGQPLSDPHAELVASRLSSVKNILLILSGKGGVGKSTVAAQLALELATDPTAQIGLLDIDICGPSQPHLMGLSGEEVHTSASGWSPVYHSTYPNLGVMSIGFLVSDSDEPIIWRGPRKNGLIKQFLSDVDWGALEFLVVDCPPGTSDEHLSIVTFLSALPSTYSLIVTIPHQLSFLDVRKEIEFCRKTGMKILGVVENMAGLYCGNCGMANALFEANEATLKMCEDKQVQLLASITMELPVAKATGEGVPVPESSRAKQTFRALVALIKSMVKC